MVAQSEKKSPNLVTLENLNKMQGEAIFQANAHY